MIRNEQEYSEAKSRLEQEAARLEEYKKTLKREGYKAPETKRLMDPLLSFHLQLKEEVEAYDRLKRGELEELTNLRSLGHALISLRIARNVSQQELADRLGVHASQVSRDERNEYHGITLERAAKILEAFGVEVQIKFNMTNGEPAAA